QDRGCEVDDPLSRRDQRRDLVDQGPGSVVRREETCALKRLEIAVRRRPVEPESFGDEGGGECVRTLIEQGQDSSGTVDGLDRAAVIGGGTRPDADRVVALVVACARSRGHSA